MVDRRDKKIIVEIHAETDGVYGSRKVRYRCWELGFQVGRRRVARSIQELDLKDCTKMRYRITTQSYQGYRKNTEPPKSRSGD